MNWPDEFFVPRPEIIAQIHEARYELRLAEGDDALKWKQNYEQLLDQAALEYRTDRLTLKRAVAADFHNWVAENGLPHLAPKQSP